MRRSLALDGQPLTPYSVPSCSRTITVMPSPAIWSFVQLVPLQSGRSQRGWAPKGRHRQLGVSDRVCAACDRRASTSQPLQAHSTVRRFITACPCGAGSRSQIGASALGALFRDVAFTALLPLTAWARAVRPIHVPSVYLLGPSRRRGHVSHATWPGTSRLSPRTSHAWK